MAWNMKLLETMKDPSAIVIKTEQLVAVKDKFPKAKHHFLILPYAKIDTVFDMTRKDINLVNEMELLSLNVIESIGQTTENFFVGFHAVPSMIRAHLHVISKDFISPCLKTKAHWNSFNTPFLWPVSKILHDLETFGKVGRITLSEEKNLLSQPLKCNSCPYAAKTIPDLRRHLLTHEDAYTS